MKKVHKYQISLHNSVPTADGLPVLADLPKAAKIVNFAQQGLDPNVLTFWYEFDAKNETTLEQRDLLIVGTGHTFLDDTLHRGSIVQPDFVWHLYERTRAPQE